MFMLCQWIKNKSKIKNFTKRTRKNRLNSVAYEEINGNIVWLNCSSKQKIIKEKLLIVNLHIMLKIYTSNYILIKLLNSVKNWLNISISNFLIIFWLQKTSQNQGTNPYQKISRSKFTFLLICFNNLDNNFALNFEKILCVYC